MYQALRALAKQALLKWEHRAAERTRQRLGSAAHGLPPSCWDLSVNASGHLAVQGRDMVDLATRHGTPLYVVDADRLARNYHTFLDSFREHFHNVIVGYSYKTNPLPGVLDHLHRLGAFAEVISHFELWLARRLGVPPERIILNGPAKTAECLNEAVGAGIYMINIDSHDEVDAIERLAAHHGRIQDVAVRVITSVGWASQFGVNIANGQAARIFDKLSRCPNLRPRGIHIHLGTGLRDIDTYLCAIREVMELAQQVESENGIRIDRFDFGGGFAVPTVRPLTATDSRLLANGYPATPMEIEQGLGPEVFAGKIARLVAEYRSIDAESGPTLIFEPGRAITSSAQSLLLRVLGVKSGGRDETMVIADGGKNITMPLGYEYHEILLASGADGKPTDIYDLYGPLCHPADVLARRKRLPSVEPGAVLAVMDAGAYFVPNQMNFSNPRPAAVMVEDGMERVIRKREMFADVVALDEWANPPASQSTTESSKSARSAVSRARE